MFAIEGLAYQEQALSVADHVELMRTIQAVPESAWVPVAASLHSRKVLQFGAAYNYKTRNVESTSQTPPFPIWLQQLADRIAPDMRPTQCIINRYLQGQLISAHTDSAVFGDKIVCFSLGSTASMVFRATNNTVTPKSLTLQVADNSFYTMEHDARWNYTHEMRPLTPVSPFAAADATPLVRWSITFRGVKAQTIARRE
jgi:alkylated DNA repair dioxygenase AlkB